MEWVTLAMWIIVLLTAAPLAIAVGSAPSLLLAGPIAIAGLVLTVLWEVLDDGDWPAWAAVGVAVLGTLIVSVGAYRLISDERPVVSAAVEESAALGTGVALPMFIVAGCLSLLLATIG
jgi:hypothetical protein